MLDGVYRRAPDGSPAFIEAASPTDDELHALLQTVIARLMKLLTRRGVLVEDMGQTWLAEPQAEGEEVVGLAKSIATRTGGVEVAGDWAVIKLPSPEAIRASAESGRRHTWPGQSGPTKGPP
ncbi:MAG: hypothetical protein O9335_16695, partial [Inhella sp.]|nr:hypothetical protein [Inhella sp.]